MNEREFFPEKDQDLRRDVSTLATLFGEVLREQCGDAFFERVEAVRRDAIARRSDEDAARSGDLVADLAGLSVADAGRLVRAFTEYFHLANLAEIVHRIRRGRDYLREPDAVQPESLAETIGQLVAEGLGWDAIVAYLGRMSHITVFTAHPTEAIRRTILEKEQRIVRLLLQRLDPSRTAVEERAILTQIRQEVTSSWQTKLHPTVRPTVADEMEHVLFYLTDVLYRVVPTFYDALRNALTRHFPAQAQDFRMPVILRFGSWVGGDMDGNPNVDAATIRQTFRAHRQLIIHGYLGDVRTLARELSQSKDEVGVSDAVEHRRARYAAMFPDVQEAIPERHRDMPYRCLLTLMAARLEATRADADERYRSAAEFANDLQIIRASLEENRGRNAGMVSVRRLQQRARTFGFHLATLDVRQDALVHREAVAEVMADPDWLTRPADQRKARLATVLAADSVPRFEASPATERTLEVFRAIREGRDRFGAGAMGLFIVSMTQGPDDVLSVLLLAKVAGLVDERGTVPLDVAPLLETVDDLKAGPAILEALLALPVYREHLARREACQRVMVGYSDSNKDGGIVAARWALRQAQENLVAVADDHDIRVGFFHGRGGTVSRGGGNTRGAIVASPRGSVNGYLRVTEQGEVIHRKYAFRQIALRNLEQSAGAMLLADLRAPEEDPEQHRWQEIMDLVAREARRAYRALVFETPEFIEYFRSATPIDVIERLSIGSRPPARRSGQGIENLRAIPWVFAWGQTRTAVPGSFGLGTALEVAGARFGATALARMLRTSPMFGSLVNDVEMVLAKSDLDIGEAYAALAPEAVRAVFGRIRRELALTIRWILELKGQTALLDDQPVLQRSIRLRNPYLDPMNFVQIELLRAWRESKRKDDEILDALFTTVNGISRGMQNTG